jgi:hypothetical protein
MVSIDIVLTLVFSVVMLLFMAFPAIKIVEWLELRFDVLKRWHNPLVLGVTVSLSLAIGLFLRFF